LDYKTFRHLIQPGDIIAFTHNGWWSVADLESQLVRIITRSEYSHVGIAWPVGGRVMILEAVKGLFGLTRDSNKRWQCAEYALAVLRIAGAGIDCRATPTDLVRELMSLGAPVNMVTK